MRKVEENFAVVWLVWWLIEAILGTNTNTTAMNRSDMAFKLLPALSSDDNEGHFDYYRTGGDPPNANVTAAAVGWAETTSLYTPIVLADQHSLFLVPTTVTASFGESQIVDSLSELFTSIPTANYGTMVCC